ncbi:alpha-L-fucosidase [Crossiella sp. NPDC003009]
MSRSPHRWPAAALALAAALAVLSAPAQARPAAQPGPGTNFVVDDPFTSPRARWWRTDRFGLFLHLGAYTQFEGVHTFPDGSTCEPDHAEHIWNKCGLSTEVYEEHARKFNPAGFDADAIVRLAKAAGQRYVVFTAKHHDGYAMWPTKVNTFNLRDMSAFDRNRDLIAELKQATERHGLDLALYYGAWDLHDPDYADLATRPKYIERMKAQLKELITGYRPKMLWLDGSGRSNSGWTEQDGLVIEPYLRELDPKLLINNRARGTQSYLDGDFTTPENTLPDQPVTGVPAETCMSINGTWGYSKNDTDFKSAAELTRHLLTATSQGGNYLLNVGPDANGRIPAAAAARLTEVGQWIQGKGHSRAIYGAGGTGLVAKPAWGTVTRADNLLYAAVRDWPTEGSALELTKVAPFSVTSARVLGSAQPVTVADTGDRVRIAPTGKQTNPIATVVELTIEQPPTSQPGDGTGLTAEFWTNPNLEGVPAVTRTDPAVNYDWRLLGSPAPEIPAGAHSARWSGTISVPATATYEFIAVSPDAVRLTVNGTELIGANTKYEKSYKQTVPNSYVRLGRVHLAAGAAHQITLEHKQNSGIAAMKLLWASPYLGQQVIPAAWLKPRG